MEMRFAKRKKKFSIIDSWQQEINIFGQKCLDMKILSVHHIDYAIVNCSEYIIGSENG